MANYMYSYGEKNIMNGNIIQDTSVKAEYNGKNLHVDKIDNNKFMHYTLDNKALHHLLKNNRNKIDLIDRLRTNYTRKSKHKNRRHTKKNSKLYRKKHPKKRF